MKNPEPLTASVNISTNFALCLHLIPQPKPAPSHQVDRNARGSRLLEARLEPSPLKRAVPIVRLKGIAKLIINPFDYSGVQLSRFIKMIIQFIAGLPGCSAVGHRRILSRRTISARSGRYPDRSRDPKHLLCTRKNLCFNPWHLLFLKKGLRAQVLGSSFLCPEALESCQELRIENNKLEEPKVWCSFIRGQMFMRNGS